MKMIEENNVISISKYKNCNQNKISLINPYSYGDVLLVCGFKDAIEKYYDTPIHFIIKPEHEIIMKLYGITDYSVKRFEKDELREISKIAKLEAGCLFIAHPEFLNDNKKLLSSFCEEKFSFIELFRKTLGLPDNVEFRKPKNIPVLSDKLKKKIENIASLSKIVLFLPEAFSLPMLIDNFWENKAKDLKKDGYIVISSVKERQNVVKGTVYLPLSFEESLAIAINCVEVYAVRSGFVDVLAQYTDKINVIYPDLKTYLLYSMKYFGKSNIKEDIVSDSSVLAKYGPCFQLECKIQSEQEIKEKMVRFCLTLFRVKKCREKTKYSILGIPVLVVKAFLNYKRWLLFGILLVYEEKI